MARVEICLLGAFLVTVDGEVVTRFESETARGLLAYLAAEPGRARSRPALAEMLWPGRPPGAALHNLRHTLSGLRHVLGDDRAAQPVLEATRTRVRLVPSADVVVDLVEAERLAAVPPSQADAAEAWERAAAWLRRPLLDDVELRAGPEWDEWLVVARERARRAAVDLLGRLAEHHEQVGRLEAALGDARGLVEVDPWDESAHRRLMRLLARDGQSAAALAHLDELRRRLRDELDVEPAAETLGLAEAIRAGHLPTLPPGPVPPDVGPTGPAELFVGQASELAWLQAQVEAAVGGDGRVAFVAGEAGSGKTMLAAEGTRRALAALPELVVAFGRCNASGGVGDPYLPFRELVEQLTGDLGVARATGLASRDQLVRLWEVGPTTARLVARRGPHLIGPLVPGAVLLARMGAAVPGAPWLDDLRTAVAASAVPTTGRPQEALFGELTQVLREVADHRPLLLVVDDLHWADAGSVGALVHLGRRLAGSRILLLGIFRPEELELPGVEGAHPVASAVRELQVQHGAGVLTLTGSRAFVDAYLDAAPTALGEDVRARLFRETGGLPLFTVELVRALRERGDLRRDAEGRWVADPDVEWSALPSRLEAVIAERLAWLPEALQRDLTVASVQGEAFTVEVLAAAQGREVADVAARLGREAAAPGHLVEAGTVQRVADRLVSQHRFRHVLFQRYLYGHLDEAERVRLHEATALAIQRLAPEGQALPVVELAHHFDEARLPAQAVRYLGEAGQRAVGMSAPAEAIRLLDRALVLLHQLPEGPERDALELSVQAPLGWAWQARGGYAAPGAGVALERARVLCERMAPSPFTVMVLGFLAAYVGMRGDMVAGEALSRRTLDVAERLGDPALVLVGLSELTYHLNMRGRLDEARACGERALALHDPEAHAWVGQVQGDDPGIGARSWTALTLANLGFVDQARAVRAEALGLAHQCGLPLSLGHALNVAGCLVDVNLGDHRSAHAHAAELEDVAAREHLAFYQAAAAVYRGVADIQAGDAAAGLASVRQGLAGWRAIGVESFFPSEVGFAAGGHLRTGDLTAGLAWVDDAFAEAARMGETVNVPLLHLRRGELLAAQGHPGAAEEAMRAALALADEGRARTTALQAATALAELLAGTRRTGEGVALLQPVVAWFPAGLDFPFLAEARATLQRLHAG